MISIKRDFAQKSIIVLILAYFLIASSAFLDKLELNNDEAIIGIGALALITPHVPPAKLRHFNSLVMFSPHKGKVASFPEAILFLIFGKSVFALRFVQVLFSLGSLLCIYYICSCHFNRMVGLVTILLLGIDSNFIRATRIGNMQDSILQIFLFWLGLSLVQVYLDKGKRVFLYASGFIFGVALWAKLMALGYILGVLVSFFIFGKKSYTFIRTRIFNKKRDVIFFIVAFILGCAPLLIFNIFSRWFTIVDIAGSFTRFGTNIGIWDNMDFLNNLKMRIGHFSLLLEGLNVGDSMAATSNNYINLLFFYFSLSFVLLYSFIGKMKEMLSKNKILFLIITYGILLCLSCFLPRSGSFDPGHLIILLPIVQIVEAICLSLIFIYFKNKIWAYVIILSIIIPQASMEFNIMREILDNLKKEERAPPNFALLELTNYLNSNNIKEVFCLDKNFVQNIDFLSGLKVITWGFGERETFWFHPLHSYRRLLASGSVNVETVYEYELKKMNPLYVLINRKRDPSVSLLHRLGELTQRDKKTIYLVNVFADRLDITHYELYRIEDVENKENKI